MRLSGKEGGEKGRKAGIQGGFECFAGGAGSEEMEEREEGELKLGEVER